MVAAARSRSASTSAWFYETNTGSRGPVPFDQVIRLLSIGAIAPDTKVWCPAENVEPTPLKDTMIGADNSAPTATQWHYERAGTRVGPVDEAELRRLLAAGEITRDTLVWSPGVGASFVRLGDTALGALRVEPPALPASVVGDTLAWELAAAPLGFALVETVVGPTSMPLWGLPVAAFLLCTAISVVDERRVVRSGVADSSINLGSWTWLVPVYLFQRAWALRKPKFYLWVWGVSLIASLAITAGDMRALLNGDTYFGTGVPWCDSSFEKTQVRKLFDSMGAAKAVGVTSTGLTNPRELGNAGDLRTCAAQLVASNGESYRVVYTVEKRDDKILTQMQLQQ